MKAEDLIGTENTVNDAQLNEVAVNTTEDTTTEEATATEETVTTTEETTEEPALTLDNIAGFKAVDVNGTEVSVSKEELVSLITSEVQTKMNTPAITPLSATAAAVTDQFEDQLPVVNGVTYVRGLDASGNPILISSGNLATVLGGLLGTGSMFKYRGKASGDANNLSSGFYSVYLGSSASSLHYYVDYGIIAVFRGTTEDVGFQIMTNADPLKPVMAARIKWGNDWSVWKVLF